MSSSDPGVGSAGLVRRQTVTLFEPPHSLPLDCGACLGPVTLAYQTYGTLSPERDNAILILHALSGDAHVAGYHDPNDRRPGWWDGLVGPGKGFDTDRYFIVCSNVIGGCQGSTGPGSIDPATGRPFGLRFPVITIGDMVRAQRGLMEHLGIPRWLCVSGGSMGGMQALQWAVDYPDLVESAIPLGACLRESAQAIAFNEVGRRAIMTDPRWRNGEYYDDGDRPTDGLAVARMIGHITYLSEPSMEAKFGRRLRGKTRYDYSLRGIEFEVESYLKHQGDSFNARFDANSYLYITRAMDYFDLLIDEASVARLSGIKARFLVISITSDWLYPTAQSIEIVETLRRHGVDARHWEMESILGHDAFLLEDRLLAPQIGEFLESVRASRPARAGRSAG
ncbi:MAG TPA: homoserine O-acetyltransferase [Dehalococcoidia bacterium]|nr:homoserine O-acetyltransferase [Dehalococcoidia bacterium]